MMVYTQIRKINFCLIFSIVLFSGKNIYGQENMYDKDFISKIYTECLVNGTAYATLKELCKTYPQRLSGSKGAEGAVQWAVSLLQKRGFDHVFLQDVVAEHWERGEKESAILVSGSTKQELAILALGRSVATPSEGLTAPVVEVKSLEEIPMLGEENIQGKIVFYNKVFEPQHINTGMGYSQTVKIRSKGPSLAAFYGARAVVIRSLTTARDDYPHTGALKYAPDTIQIPAAALSYLAADYLEQALKEDPHLSLTLKISSRQNLPVKTQNVIGEIKGSENPEQIILVGGHLDSWDVGEGAHDDGAGCMQAVSALTILKKMGYMPKNTIRVVLFANEENGLNGGKQYAQQALNNKEKHLFALESDFGGFTPRAFTFSGSDSSLQKMRSWLALFPDLTIRQILEISGGPDIGPLHKADGTPDSQRYFDFHHSEKDVFEAINERELELGTASMAALLYLVDKYGLQD
jgi:hypothetical protein